MAKIEAMKFVTQTMTPPGVEQFEGDDEPPTPAAVTQTMTPPGVEQYLTGQRAGLELG